MMNQILHRVTICQEDLNITDTTQHEHFGLFLLDPQVQGSEGYAFLASKAAAHSGRARMEHTLYVF